MFGEKFYIPKPRTHLSSRIEGARPIFACVGTPDDFEKSGFSPEQPLQILGLGNDAQNIDSEGDTSILKLDESNKYSKAFSVCTGLVVTGISRKTGKNVSFLSHQNANDVLEGKFISSLRKLLNEINDECEPGTIDAVVIGGYNVGGDNYTKKNYLNSIKLLGKEVKKALKFEPMVVNGPKIGANKRDDIYYDTENRRLFFIRPEVNRDIGDFPTGDVKKQKSKWS